MDMTGLDKRTLRRELIAVRDEIPEAVRKEAEERFVLSIKELPVYKASENVLLYASCGSELSTFELIHESLRIGKKVFLPKVKGRVMDFYRICDTDELISGYKGIYEPSGESEKYAFTNNSLLIMPGVAFDIDGYRLGYGGGFYDRYLSENKELVKDSIAVGFKRQEVTCVPHDEFDIRPGRILLF